MKLGLTRRFRTLVAHVNTFRFAVRRKLLGFEYANILLSRLDKRSTELILRRNGAQIGRQCDIESGLVFHNCMDYSNLKIGDNCHIGKNCFFDLKSSVIIEDNVVISMRCNFITHTDLEKSPLSKIYPAETSGIRIRENCYLGINATVLKGVTIGKGSIVGANALVLKSMPSGAIIGGVPARKLKDIL
ncbi:MAG: acyltransferase [Lewinellaceae bacterium]|nr:acyltransferase [Lewinellaceae bacterium]